MGGPVRRAVYYCSVSARPDPARGTASRSWLAALLCAVLTLPAHSAESLGELYSVSVPYTGQNEAAFRDAMRARGIEVFGLSAPAKEGADELLHALERKLRPSAADLDEAVEREQAR